MKTQEPLLSSSEGKSGHDMVTDYKYVGIDFRNQKLVYLVEKGICIPSQIENLILKILKIGTNIISILEAQWDMMQLTNQGNKLVFPM